MCSRPTSSGVTRRGPISGFRRCAGTRTSGVRRTASSRSPPSHTSTLGVTGRHPCGWSGPGAWEPTLEPPEWLASETRPIILVTSSTAYQRDAKLISTALEAFAGEDVAMVATSAAHDPSAFTAPANAYLDQFLPHGPIIARAECVI